jgi:hypothetical protein
VGAPRYSQCHAHHIDSIWTLASFFPSRRRLWRHRRSQAGFAPAAWQLTATSQFDCQSNQWSHSFNSHSQPQTRLQLTESSLSSKSTVGQVLADVLCCVVSGNQLQCWKLTTLQHHTAQTCQTLTSYIVSPVLYNTVSDSTEMRLKTTSAVLWG